MSRKVALMLALMLAFTLSTVGSTATDSDVPNWNKYIPAFWTVGTPGPKQKSTANPSGHNPSVTGGKPKDSFFDWTIPDRKSSVSWTSIAFKCVFRGDCNCTDIATRFKAWVNAKMPYVREVSGVMHHFPENIICGTIRTFNGFKKNTPIIYCIIFYLMHCSTKEVIKTIRCVHGNPFAMNIIIGFMILKRGAAFTEVLLSTHLSDDGIDWIFILLYNVYTLSVLNQGLSIDDITSDERLLWLYWTNEQLIYRRIVHQVVYRGWCPVNIIVIPLVIYYKKKRWGQLLVKAQWDKKWQGPLTFSVYPFYVAHLSYLIFIELGYLPIWYWCEPGSSNGHLLFSQASGLLGLWSLCEPDVFKLFHAFVCGIEYVLRGF